MVYFDLQRINITFDAYFATNERLYTSEKGLA
jgi:hypothetical protein